MRSLAGHSIQIDQIPVVEGAIPSGTVVICTRNRPELLRRCLEGIVRMERAPDEVIVVDNSPGDLETKRIARQFEASYVVEPLQGVSRARNRGMAEAHSEIVAYLDDDATPDVNWLGSLLVPFKDPQVAVVTGKVVTPRSPTENGAHQTARFLSNKVPEWFEIASFGGLGVECNMAIRKRACAGQRIFDERLGRGAPFQIAEGHYAFALLLSRGYSAVYLPNAIVFHPAPKPIDINDEASNSIAYSMLLLSEFPANRLDFLRFLYRRLRRKPLSWPRDSPDPGEVITSGWRVLFAAAISALMLFFRTRKPRGE